MSLIYLDNDDIPELVVDRYGWNVSIYTYDGKQSYTIMEEWGYGTGGFYEYLPRKNVIAGIYASAGYGNIDEYWIQNDAHKLVKYLTYSLPYDSDGEFDYDNVQYYYGDLEITEDEYNNYYIDGNYETLEGTKSADAMIQTIKGM